MNGNHATQHKRSLEDLLNLRRSAWDNYLRAARHRRFSWRQARNPLYQQLKSFINTISWVVAYLTYRFGLRHPFQDYVGNPSRGIYPLVSRLPVNGDLPAAGPIRVSLAGDWGTGTPEADAVANHIRAFDPHYTIHLGDIYFVGDLDEVEENCLGNPQRKNIYAVTWPKGSHGTFALNGNHEMYANGHAYFKHFLPRLGMRLGPGMEAEGQKASFFSLRNNHWIIVALDTGYNSVGLPIFERLAYIKKIPKMGGNGSLPPALLHWLRQDVRPQLEGRGVIVLSHHQYYSSFEGCFPTPGRQLLEFISKPVLWFWGNEHRMAIYGRWRMKRGIEAYGRCVGHGGMPIAVGAKPRHKPNAGPLVLYDDREYRQVSGTTVGYNGYVNLVFEGRHLTIEYRDVREGNNLLLTEEWEARDGMLVGKDVHLRSSDKNLRQYHPDLREAIRSSAAQETVAV